MTHFQICARFCQDKHVDQVSWLSGWKCGLQSIHKVFLRFYLVFFWHDPFSNWFEILSIQIFWSSFIIIGMKGWLLERTQVFSKIWTKCSFWSDMTHFRNWSEISPRQTFWPSFMISGLKMWPLERTQGFSKIWPSDLVFDSTRPIFEIVRDFIKTNILIKFHDYQTEMWPLERTQDEQLTTHDGRRTTDTVLSQ